CINLFSPGTFDSHSTHKRKHHFNLKTRNFEENGGTCTGFIIPISHGPDKNMEGIYIQLLEAGIEINGKAPHDIQVHNEMFYRRFAQDEILGFAEAYMDGWIDVESIDEVFNRIILGGLYKKYFQFPWNKICHYLEFQLFNNQTAKRSFEVGQKHYDLGNALYESFLD
ncbi:unnamed protein product, partial [Allacma fusca]